MTLEITDPAGIYTVYTDDLTGEIVVSWCMDADEPEEGFRTSIAMPPVVARIVAHSLERHVQGGTIIDPAQNVIPFRRRA